MKVLLSCGGTGGHIYPALAIAEQLKDCFFVGANRLEKELIPRAGHKFFEISAHSRDLLKIARGFFQSLEIINREKPDVIISTGGYVTIPVILAGLALGKNIFLQEQNILPGKVNRLISYVARTVFASYEESRKYFAKGKVVVTGNPVRKEIAAINYNLEEVFEGRTVLVFGGSLSARSINEAIYAMQKTQKLDFQIIHLDGKTYCHDMAAVYKKATLIVCRAGATSLAEIAAIGIPAILVPYPYAAENHQELNARYFAQKGAAIMLLDKEMTPENLFTNIIDLLNNKEKLKKMNEAMQQLGNKKAGSLLLDQL